MRAQLTALQQRCLAEACRSGTLVPFGPSWFRAWNSASALRRFHHRTVRSLEARGLLKRDRGAARYPTRSGLHLHAAAIRGPSS